MAALFDAGHWTGKVPQPGASHAPRRGVAGVYGLGLMVESDAEPAS